MQEMVPHFLSGQTLFGYLRPRIFRPLGISGEDWDLNPQGINLGMIGLRLRTEDLAKFGQLLLQQGAWNKKQLVPKEWIQEATSFKIESSGGSARLPKDQNDWAQGYCYQMWRGRYNTVRLDGMAGVQLRGTMVDIKETATEGLFRMLFTNRQCTDRNHNVN